MLKSVLGLLILVSLSAALFINPLNETDGDITKTVKYDFYILTIEW